MLNQYKNIDQILNSSASLTAERISIDKRSLFSKPSTNLINFNSEITTPGEDHRVELHIYSGNTWVTGNHQVQLKFNIPAYYDNVTKKLINFKTQPVAIDLRDEVSKLNLTSGQFKVIVNFFKNLIGSFNQQFLYIDEISPDRTELRLKAFDETNPIFLQQISNYINTVKQTQTITNGKVNYFKTYLLNFSRNKCISFVNSVVIGDYIYIKLQDTLPDEFDINLKCWIVEEQKYPYVDSISIIPNAVSKNKHKTLANPNWYANATHNISSDTGLKNWTDLLSSTTQTSQQIIDSYFSGSLSGIELNIDYTDFNNFIFYSSATERIENFKYKLQLLEYYTSQSNAVSLISGSTATTNVSDINKQRDNLISGFDSFEKFLYFESSSKLSTHTLPLENANVPSITGSYITPIPKTTSNKPYSIASVNSIEFSTWYSNVINYASQYDIKNNNALINTIPEYIRLDENNVNISTFVNMLGHHYDILYTYINHMSKINKRDENPKVGMPNELLYSVAKQFGWNLTNGNQHDDLWSYVLGTNSTGTYLTGSIDIGVNKPSKENTFNIWRRVVNNLPLLLKTKGTKRSIQALLSCYGIPQSMITIKEYGGPRIDRTPIYEKLNFDYSLDLINNTSGTVTVNYSQSINTVELRFRTDNVVTNPLIPSNMTLFTIGSNVVTLDYTSGTLGTIQINGTSSADIELFDGTWLTAMLRTTGSNLQVVAKKSKYGKIVAAVSASALGSFDISGSLVLGGTSVGSSRLQGQLQELRFWSSSLNDSVFDNHVKAPAAYNGNTDAYNELVYRLPLTQKINHATTSSLFGVEPVSSNISASFTSWTNPEPYDSIEETYYYDSVSLGTGTYDDNKIRLEQNELIGTLDFKTRAERSQYDKAPVDSNKLGVYFSPQTMIDEDIIAQLGFTSLDDYIGDPGDDEKKSYPRLVKKSYDYWKKYTDKNDINAYIKIFTLFDLSFFKQLDQLLPARVNKLTGVLIQPNILERSKDTILPVISQLDNTLNVTITEVQPTASAQYNDYVSTIEGKILTVTSSYDISYEMNLTASASTRYNGTVYNYPYLLWNGTTFITASTPYWRDEAILPSYINAVASEYMYNKSTLQYTGSIGSYKFTGSLSNVQNYNPSGIANHKYNGTKISSSNFNIDSTDTIDGGPVVEYKIVNSNQLIYQNFGSQGSFKVL